MSVRETSLEAYFEPARQSHAKRQAERVLEFFQEHPLSTRKECARFLNMQEAAVSARCNKLLADQQLQEHGTTKCSISGRTVAAVQCVPKQLRLI